MTRFLPPEPPGQTTPVCRLVLHRDHLLVTLTGAGSERTVRLDGVNADRLDRLTVGHRSAVLEWSSAGDALVPVSPTEIYLLAVYDLVSVHLVDLLSGLARVALVPEGPVLRLLPLETAHRPGRPTLSECTPCFRTSLPLTADASAGGVVEVPERRRRFRLEQHQGRDTGLQAVEVERRLVAALHRPDSRPHPALTERLVHLAGHEPRIPASLTRAGERSHLVLSGCDSLPSELPPGVASAAGSLWPVADHANATFMATYHSRLSLGVPPLEALRQAQLLHRSLPPGVWAAYVHLGQPQ